MIAFDRFVDARGELVAGEIAQLLPFECRRIFIVHQVPVGAVRGAHAHRQCHEVLVAASGQVTVDVDDGDQRATFVLDDPSKALHLPPMVWTEQRAFSPDAALLVLNSHAYDEDDYIRDRAQFHANVRAERA